MKAACIVILLALFTACQPHTPEQKKSSIAPVVAEAIGPQNTNNKATDSLPVETSSPQVIVQFEKDARILSIDRKYPDFKSANYFVDHDISAQVTRVRSKINFVAGPLYAPIFDSVGLTSAEDELGLSVSTPVKASPDRSTKYRVMNLAPHSGFHKIEMISHHSALQFNAQTSYTMKNFNVQWDMSDWVERGFLERYVPAPMESDLFTASFHIRVMADKQYLDTDRFEIISNAERVTRKKNEFLLEHIKPINSSSIYVHVFEKELFNITRDTFLSRSGNRIPITFYAHKKHGSINWIPQIKNALTRLENLVAPWPHASVIVRAEPASNWGMEFRGATFTDRHLIFHELAHSYFGRGVLSANGRAGYIDESIVKWLEAMPADHSQKVEITFLRNRPIFSRSTDTRVYRIGASYIAGLRAENGWKSSTNDFIKSVFTKYYGIPLSDDEFQKHIKEFE